MTGEQPPVRTLALDLEGTLISNAVSQFPRPGLLEFLRQVAELVPRRVVFTAASPAIARRICRLLVDEGEAPPWFSDVAIVHSIDGLKDLRSVDREAPETVLIVDDREEGILPTQRDRWIRIAEFIGNDPNDQELGSVLSEIRRRVIRSQS